MLKERLINYARAKSISLTDFEKAAGLANGTFTHMKNGIRTDKFRDILIAFPDLNPDYALGLSDIMLRGSNDTQRLIGEMDKMKAQIDLYEKVIKKLSE